MRRVGILEAFGRVLRETRLANKLSQDKVAADAGLSRNYITDLEAGRKRASIITIFSLARALQTTPAALMARTDRLTR